MQDFRQQLTRDRRESGRWEQFDTIEAGDYKLSTQASEGAYCTPRESLDDVYSYSAMEVALFTKSGGWVHPSHIAGMDSKFEDMWEPSDLRTFVGPYINVEDIQELYEFLCNHKSDPRGTIEEWVNKATKAGLASFWSTVAARFPEISMGDLDPLTVANTESVMGTAASEWVELNQPDKEETEEDG